MSAGKMHADELDIDVALARRLLAAQFPRWADLPIAPVASAGTDNALFRLGDDMVVRLPRIDWAVEQVEKEQRWLPRLAPRLPLAIPVPLAMGVPAEGYPWHWSIYRWLEGENATVKPIADLHQTATELAQFVTALREIDPGGGPSPGPHNSFRGEPLANRDARTRAAIASLGGLLGSGKLYDSQTDDRKLDIDAATEVWEEALQAPAWHGPPVWIHGDLSPLNLLVERGRLTAVVDFGCLGVGDPAGDLIVAWSLLSADTRAVFRAALAVDDATWARGRGWALSVGLIALPYYQITNPVLAATARRMIDEAIADHVSIRA
jgi:aminoglycoside phosphotransferase (APT) family kinase protein